jgi:GNAT superfamily N-acetyltransferase
MEAERDGYLISDDPARVDLDVTWGFLRTAYWSENVPREVVERSIANSLPIGLYDSAGAQVGFARVVTDSAAFAWIADVFVLEGHRGRGLGRWLIETVLSHPALDALRVVMLATADAHSLYESYGFKRVEPDRYLVLRRSTSELYGPPGD